MITNNYNLPQSLVSAVTNDSYDAGDSDFTATSLLKPAWQSKLMLEHRHELIEDASDRIWSLLGQSVHTILERAGSNDIKEKRYYARFGQWQVSAQIDNLRVADGVVEDYKVTTAWQFKTDQPIKPEFEQQLNIQAELLRRNGFAINQLKIIGILRDWSKMEAQRNDNYPKSQVLSQNVPLWTSDKTTAFINMRIAALLNPRPCSPSEMWEREGKWAVKKNNNKRAIKLHHKEESAFLHIEQLGDGHEMEYRPGARTRCENYCSVNTWCESYKNYLKEKNDGNEKAAQR